MMKRQDEDLIREVPERAVARQVDDVLGHRRQQHLDPGGRHPAADLVEPERVLLAREGKLGPRARGGAITHRLAPGTGFCRAQSGLPPPGGCPATSKRSLSTPVTRSEWALLVDAPSTVGWTSGCPMVPIWPIEVSAIARGGCRRGRSRRRLRCRRPPRRRRTSRARTAASNVRRRCSGVAGAEAMTALCGRAERCQREAAGQGCGMLIVE